MQWEPQPGQGVLRSQFALPSPSTCPAPVAHGYHAFAVQAPHVQHAWHELPASPQLCGPALERFYLTEAWKSNDMVLFPNLILLLVLWDTARYGEEVKLWHTLDMKFIAISLQWI